MNVSGLTRLSSGRCIALKKAADRDLANQLETWITDDPHDAHYGGLFAPDGTRLAGNLVAVPVNLAPSGKPQTVALSQPGKDNDHDDPEIVRASLITRPDGSMLAVAYDVDEIEDLDEIVIHALTVAVLPITGLSIALGWLLARRAQRRVGAVHQAINRIMAGDLKERLPSNGTGDELDKVSIAVNRMLEEVSMLVDEIKGIGDNVAHELRTPLTRVRTKLERCRDEAATLEEFRFAVDRAIESLDQVLGIAEAVMRIGEINHERRRAEFGAVQLHNVVEDVAEMFAPIAEEFGIQLKLLLEHEGTVIGDRDLLLEAIGNLVDNAIKFAPRASEVVICLTSDGPNMRVLIVDRGPGIPLMNASAFC